MKKTRERILCLVLAVLMCTLPAIALAEDLVLATWEEMREKYTTPVEDAVFPVTESESYTWLTVSEKAAEEHILLGGYDAQGNRIDEESWGRMRLCTGQTGIAIQEVLRKYVLFALVIRGDVLGTGQLSIAQLVRLAQAVTGSRPLEGVWAQAGDLNDSGAPDIADLTMLASWLTGGGPRQTDPWDAFFRTF